MNGLFKPVAIYIWHNGMRSRITELSTSGTLNERGISNRTQRT